MAKEDVKKLHELLKTDPSVLEDLKAGWAPMEKLMAKHGLKFSHTEYFDYLHDHLGMTKVGKSDHESHDDTDTCWFCISEPPSF